MCRGFSELRRLLGFRLFACRRIRDLFRLYLVWRFGLRVFALEGNCVDYGCRALR